jgi:hypothetical protein
MERTVSDSVAMYVSTQYRVFYGIEHYLNHLLESGTYTFTRKQPNESTSLLRKQPAWRERMYLRERMYRQTGPVVSSRKQEQQLG